MRINIRGLLAHAAHAGTDGEEHRPDRIVEIECYALAFFVDRDFRGMPGAFGDKQRVRRAIGHRLHDLGRTITESAFIPQAAQKHAHGLRVIHDRCGNHALNTRPADDAVIMMRDGGRRDVVVHPLNRAHRPDLAAQAAAAMQRESRKFFGHRSAGVFDLDIAAAILFGDPSRVQAVAGGQ